MSSRTTARPSARSSLISVCAGARVQLLDGGEAPAARSVSRPMMTMSATTRQRREHGAEIAEPVRAGEQVLDQPRDADAEPEQDKPAAGRPEQRAPAPPAPGADAGSTGTGRRRLRFGRDHARRARAGGFGASVTTTSGSSSRNAAGLRGRSVMRADLRSGTAAHGRAEYGAMPARRHRSVRAGADAGAGSENPRSRGAPW